MSEEERKSTTSSIELSRSRSRSRSRLFEVEGGRRGGLDEASDCPDKYASLKNAMVVLRDTGTTAMQECWKIK
jgi:hypothetical protein